MQPRRPSPHLIAASAAAPRCKFAFPLPLYPANQFYSPEELETALVALSESVANALRALDNFRSCRRQERSELLVVQSVEGVGFEAPSGSDEEFVSAEED